MASFAVRPKGRECPESPGRDSDRDFRQQFVPDKQAVRPTRDDVGEGAAAIDPELPPGHPPFHAHAR
jgi:hypothetical protein